MPPPRYPMPPLSSGLQVSDIARRLDRAISPAVCNRSSGRPRISHGYGLCTYESATQPPPSPGPSLTAVSRPVSGPVSRPVIRPVIRPVSRPASRPVSSRPVSS
eukprot:2628642-Pyramimonas_sp.AAC.1